MNFVDRYLRRVARLNSILCVGLDPMDDHVPEKFGTGLRSVEKYMLEVIQIAAEKVPVVKPQYAYFAAYGTAGLDLLHELTMYARSLGLLVILDAKRSDIGRTMIAYAEELFSEFQADAATTTPYFGPTFMPASNDSPDRVWLPWLEQGRAVISMIRTSNPDGAFLQVALMANGLHVYEFMAHQVHNWNEVVRVWTNGEGSVGGVVGATWDQASRCRQLAGDDVFFLVPGYGAQGGGAAAAVAGIRNSRGEFMGTVNSSRGITTAWFNSKTGEARDGDALDLVAQAIDAANKDLNAALQAA